MSQNHRDNTLSIVCITTLFPNKINERHGIFIYNRLKKLKELHDVKIHVISPVPLRSLAAFKKDVSSEKDAIFDSVSRPRFISIPIVNQFLSYFFIALAAFFPARRIIKKHNISVIDSHFLYPDAVSANIISKLFKLPLIVTARGSDVNYWTNKKVARLFIKHMLENSAANCAVSLQLATQMEAITTSKHVNVLRNGVDLDIFNPNQKKSGVNKITFLSVGNLIPLKGHNIVIDAFVQLSPLCPDAELHVIGEGPELENLKQQALLAGTDIERKITFIPNLPQQELAMHYANASTLILASEMEGMPNVVIEALASGLQVIATPVGDLQTIITKDVGWITNRNSTAIKEKMKESLSSAKDPTTIRKYAEAEFSWDRQIESYYGVLLSANSK